MLPFFKSRAEDRRLAAEARKIEALLKKKGWDFDVESVLILLETRQSYRKRCWAAAVEKSELRVALDEANAKIARMTSGLKQNRRPSPVNDQAAA